MIMKCQVSGVRCQAEPIDSSVFSSPVTSARRSRTETARHPSLVRAFTLIELLTVIAIIGVLAALFAPVLSHFRKGDSTLAATRQMLDDVGRARQLAISQRTTVYMVFIHTNFWQDLLRNIGQTPANQWPNVPAAIATSSTTTQLYAAQLTGYMMVSLRGVGDQPGRSIARDLTRVRTLPEDAFIPPFKFTGANPFPFTPSFAANRTDLPIYRFLRTSNIPFPTVDMTTNASFAKYVTVPYIAFNYLGQLTPGDGSLLPYDENIPLAHGSVSYSRDPNSKIARQGSVAITETPPGNSTNVSYNIIHIDRLTGRARLERQEVQ
jgi:prepilin-type N-terminal cleavage/methylation domain-containing protein